MGKSNGLEKDDNLMASNCFHMLYMYIKYIHKGMDIDAFEKKIKSQARDESSSDEDEFSNNRKSR